MRKYTIAAVAVATMAGAASAQKSVASIEVGIAGTGLSATFDLLDTDMQVDGDQIIWSASNLSFFGGQQIDGQDADVGIGEFSLVIATGAARAGGTQSVTLNFNNATASFFNTSFSFSANPVAFAALSGVVGQASAGITVIDSPFAPGGSTLAADGAGAYTATYNGGSVFTDFFGAGVSAPDGGSNSASADSGIQGIAGSVSEISAEWNFTLSALAQATGTSTFTITPTPAAAGLLGLGGLIAARRRR